MNDYVSSSRSEGSEEGRGSEEAWGAGSFGRLIFNFVRFGFVASFNASEEVLLQASFGDFMGAGIFFAGMTVILSWEWIFRIAHLLWAWA